MLNVGGGELLIIFLVALVVLGPTKLPEVARQAGKVYSEFKKISSGFQREFREAMKDPVGDAVRDVTAQAELEQVGTAADPFARAEKTSVTPDPARADSTPASDDVVEGGSGGGPGDGHVVESTTPERGANGSGGPEQAEGESGAPEQTEDEPPMSSDR